MPTKPYFPANYIWHTHVRPYPRLSDRCFKLNIHLEGAPHAFQQRLQVNGFPLLSAKEVVGHSSVLS